MRSIRFICYVAFLAVMCSCHTLSSTTTTRTARSIEIVADVQQLPTVAELVVDTIYVRQDTTWINKAFKSTTSKSTMRTLLLGEMLEKANADVIIQPRENVQVSYTNPFNQTLHMEIYGYPARYRNFRTATEEDLRILNGIDPKPVNYNTIYIGTGYEPSNNLFTPTNLAQAITPAPTELPKDEEEQTGFMRNKKISSLEIGYNAMCFMDRLYSGGHGIQMFNNYLWRLRNTCFYQGFGWGFTTNFGHYDSNTSAREMNIPMFYQMRAYFGKKKCIPFFDFRAGFFLGLHTGSKVGFASGLYYAGFLGMEFGKHFNVAFGTDQFFGGSTREGMLFDLSITAKVGINF